MRKFHSFLNDAVFYGIVDTGYVPYTLMRTKAQALKDAGAKIIQLRAKKEDAQTRRKLALEILPVFNGDNSPVFIINDDPELAASIDIAGLHVGQDDMPIREARKLLGEDRVIGLSTHSVEQAKGAIELAELLDYFAVGPVYATNTKPGREAVGLSLVENVSKMNPPLPWFAIGGVNMKTAADVKKAGAERIVAVSDVLLPDDTKKAVEELVSKFTTV